MKIRITAVCEFEAPSNQDLEAYVESLNQDDGVEAWDILEYKVSASNSVPVTAELIP